MTMKNHKSLLLALSLLLCAAGARAQEIEWADTLDTAPKKEMINDYVMIGVHYGVSFSNMYYSPARHNRAWQVAPGYISVMFSVLRPSRRPFRLIS